MPESWKVFANHPLIWPVPRSANRMMSSSCRCCGGQAGSVVTAGAAALSLVAERWRGRPSCLLPVLRDRRPVVGGVELLHGPLRCRADELVDDRVDVVALRVSSSVGVSGRDGVDDGLLQLLAIHAWLLGSGCLEHYPPAPLRPSCEAPWVSLRVSARRVGACPRGSVQSCVTVPCAWSPTVRPARVVPVQHRSVRSPRSSVSARRH